MKLRKIIKQLVPPCLMTIASYLHNAQYGLSGDYESWDDAVQASSGYDSDDILEKTTAALLKVKEGAARYERDGVLFNEVQYAWPLLSCLLLAAAQSGGNLNVLDFGGSLGSTYFQNRTFLHRLASVRWNIIDQPKHVNIGKQCFEDERLRFYNDVEEYVSENRPDVIVLSSVLQYLEKPGQTFSELLQLGCDCILIDRTPFWSGPSDRLFVQRVPPSIYRASYPCRVFSKELFIASLPSEWEIVVEFDSIDSLNAPVDATWQGMLLMKEGKSK